MWRLYDFWPSAYLLASSFPAGPVAIFFILRQRTLEGYRLYSHLATTCLTKPEFLFPGIAIFPWPFQASHLAIWLTRLLKIFKIRYRISLS